MSQSKRIQNLISTTLPNADHMNYLQHFIHLSHSLWNDFVESRCLQLAASLSYTTLLSLVPLMAVSVGILMAFPVFETLNDRLQDFIFMNFMPNSGLMIAEYLTSFTEKARQLTVTGIIFLLLTALMMMSTIEAGLNSIWRASQDRSALDRFVMYWAVLTLGPLMMGGGLMMTSYIMSLPFLNQGAANVDNPPVILKLIPLCLEVSTFTLLYWLVPNIHVRLRYALLGGISATLLFEIAKQAFSWYTHTFPTYQTVYGAIAAIPIFLVWLYVSWLVTLFGAQLTYTMERHTLAWRNFQDDDPNHLLIPTLQVLKNLWLGYQQGNTIDESDMIEQSLVSESATIDILHSLQQNNLATRDQQDHWILTRDLQQFSLWDFYASYDWVWKEADANFDSNHLAQRVRPYLFAVNEQLQNQMSVPLATLFADEDAQEPMMIASA